MGCRVVGFFIHTSQQSYSRKGRRYSDRHLIDIVLVNTFNILIIVVVVVVVVIALDAVINLIIKRVQSMRSRVKVNECESNPPW